MNHLEERLRSLLHERAGEEPHAGFVTEVMGRLDRRTGWRGWGWPRPAVGLAGSLVVVALVAALATGLPSAPAAPAASAPAASPSTGAVVVRTVDDPRDRALDRLRELAGDDICSMYFEREIDLARLATMAAGVPGGEGLIEDGSAWLGDPADAAGAFGASEAFVSRDGADWFFVAVAADQRWTVHAPTDRLVAVHLARIELPSDRDLWVPGLSEYHEGAACEAPPSPSPSPSAAPSGGLTVHVVDDPSAASFDRLAEIADSTSDPSDDCISEHEFDRDIPTGRFARMAARVPGGAGLLEDGSAWLGEVRDAIVAFDGREAWTTRDDAEWHFLTTSAGQSWTYDTPAGRAMTVSLYRLELPDGVVLWAPGLFRFAYTGPCDQ